MMTWDNYFTRLFRTCLLQCKNGNYDWSSYYTDEDLAFLHGMGYRPREFFDFVEDHAAEGDPSLSTTLLVASVRRDYFKIVQQGIWSDAPLVSMDDLPTFGDSLEGIYYLPRIIKKAQAKLTGTLDPDVMFCCGGDRKFLRDHGDIPAADFLRHVWAYGDDTLRLVEYIHACEDLSRDSVPR